MEIAGLAVGNVLTNGMRSTVLRTSFGHLEDGISRPLLKPPPTIATVAPNDTMKLSLSLLALNVAAFAEVGAFSLIVSSRSQRHAPSAIQNRFGFGGTALHMSDSFGSDFSSAMPEKPEQTLEEKLMESATTYIVTIEGQLADGVEPPAALEKLRKARDEKTDAKTLAARTYELMIEQGMTYDQDPDTGALTPTEWDIKENLETPEVKKEFSYLYQYGINLIGRGLLDEADAKEIVMKGLIERTGKTPEEFDAWLGY